jgi:hypothetical protein
MTLPKATNTSDPQTDAEWNEKAELLGVESGAVLKAQTELSDSIIAEIIEEEHQSIPPTSLSGIGASHDLSSRCN